MTFSQTSVSAQILIDASKTGANPGDNRSRNDNNLNDKKNYVEVIQPDGTITNVRKSTLIWKLSQNVGKLSSDRLKRVQGSSTSLQPARKKQKTHTESNQEDQILLKDSVVMIGEWAIFKINEESEVSLQSSAPLLQGNFLIGLILGFKKINMSGRITQYKKPLVETPCNKEYKINLQVLGCWYTCEENGKLTPVDNKKRTHVLMNNYIATIKKPIITQKENTKLSYKIPCEFSELFTLLSIQLLK